MTVSCTSMGVDQTLAVHSYKARDHVTRKPSIRIDADVGGKLVCITLPTDKARELLEEMTWAVFDAEEK